MSFAEEKLTEQFLNWEVRGRGWQLWDATVRPEPAFRAFLGHHLPDGPVVDDGRKPTSLSSLAQKFGSILTGTRSAPGVAEEEEDPQPDLLSRQDLVELQTVLPNDLDLRRDAYGYFLASISVCREPVTFELVGEAGRITAQLVVHSEDENLVRDQLGAFFPDVAVLPKREYLREKWRGIEGQHSVAVECGLSREFMRPLSISKLDPFGALLGALGGLAKDEIALYQVIFEPVRHPWGESIMRAVTDGAGDAFFVNAPDLLSGSREKVSQPLYAAVLRVAAKARDSARANAITRNVIAALAVFDNPSGNELIPLKNDGYEAVDQEESILKRETYRSGMILNTDELIGLVHLPSSEVRSPKLLAQSSKTKTAPAVVLHDKGLILGQNVHLGTETPVTLVPDQRMRHMHVIGASGTGKSTFLFNCIMQDVKEGRGVAVLDPHGDLAERVLSAIPSERIDDVVLLDPSDIEYPVGFNILFAHSELEKTLLASDLVSVFERLSNSWGDQMGSVLRSAILAFIESDRGGTLADLRRFLLEPSYRESFLATVRDPEVIYYWRKGFPTLAGNKSIGSIITRLETFLAPKSIRYMVSQQKSRLDFADILDSGKILIAKLSQGAIGKENSYLFGTLLVSKLQELAMSRQAQEESKRRDFYLYIDEFHNFMTPSMGEILAGARKYRLGLVLSHQELRQLESNREVSSAVLSNTYTRVCFRVGDQDARSLENGFSFFESKDLQNLGTGEAICRVERSDFDFSLTVPNAIYAGEKEAAERRQQVVERSRAKYAARRADVEAELALQHASSFPTQSKTPARAEPIASLPPVPVTQEKKLEPVEKIIPEEPPAKATPIREPATPGRGGREHKNLQQLIKQWAEGMGWRSTIEHQLPEGGSVDVALFRDSVSIACEIAITTSIEREVRNVRKCLAGTFTWVVSLAEEGTRRDTIKRETLAVLSPPEAARVRFLTRDEFSKFVVDQQPKVSEAKTSVKGYRVKVNYRSIGVEEALEKRRLITKIVAESVRESKGR